MVNAARSSSLLPPNSLHPSCPFPLSKMALDRDRSTTQFTKSEGSPAMDSKVDTPSDQDLEAVGEKRRDKFGRSDKNVGARIAPVLPHLVGYVNSSDDSGSDILGKQIEMEAGNAIK